MYPSAHARLQLHGWKCNVHTATQAVPHLQSGDRDITTNVLGRSLSGSRDPTLDDPGKTDSDNGDDDRIGMRLCDNLTNEVRTNTPSYSVLARPGGLRLSCRMQVRVKAASPAT